MIDPANVTDLARDLAKAYVAYFRVIEKDGIKPADFDTWMSMRTAMAQAT